MTVDVGHTLDKYELLEKVGHGGMAVVYRGLDTSLRRQVAVKVLHRHLADNEEARSRFEREAQAVAKLRHENILEIFDFSGNESEESYIVTEFIEGTTLKDFIVDHEIKFPEVAAMIAVQVCRALVHAHGLGVLHRDVKPENIMIRSDGVVKLMDFGISQMLDLQRMTVTGQLLGSPAYMAPEHVEGGQLDFRTDVFAVGIVLYQLATGRLPFSGKNPHEILKRIADCKYRDPRLVNPRIGNELGGIIKKSLARIPDDRYADVSLMLQALDGYLQGSGLKDYRDELSRFFASPVSYEMALKSRLIDHLTRRGRELLPGDRVAGLELFNRVLTLDPENRAVLDEIERLSRRRRLVRGLAAVGAAAAVAAIGIWIVPGLLGGGESPVAVNGRDADAAAVAVLAIDAASATAPDAQVAAVAVDAGEIATVDARGTGTRPVNRSRKVDAAVPEAPTRTFTLTIRPRGSEYRIGDGPWLALDGAEKRIELPAGPATVAARNETCCEGQERVIAATQTGGDIEFKLKFRPGSVIPLCDYPDVRVLIDGKERGIGRGATIIMERSYGYEQPEVVFLAEDKDGNPMSDKQRVTVNAQQTLEVTCRF